MKKSYLSWNKDTVKDDVIFEHLYELSGGSWIYFKVPKNFKYYWLITNKQTSFE
jgi:hypothetical protein